MIESWVKVERNENYSVNEDGEVRNDSTNYIKKPTLNKANGYLMHDLYKGNERKKVPVHRLVAEAFIPNDENKLTVDHIDGNRKNNSIDNLRWATYSEQNSRFNTIGVRSEKVTLTKYNESVKKRGGGHLEWLSVKEVLFFDSIGSVADYFNVSISNISSMLKKETIGKRGKMRGCKFEYTQGERAVHREGATTIETD